MPSAPRTQTSFLPSCHQRYSPTVAFFFSLAFLGFISLDRTSLAHGARLISSQETGIPSKSQQNAYTTAPCVSGKEVYFGNSSQILCLDIQTGAHRVYKDLLTYVFVSCLFCFCLFFLRLLFIWISLKLRTPLNCVTPPHNNHL